MELPSHESDDCAPADIPADRLIAEITDRARRISLEQGDDDDFVPFSNWLQAEDEIRRKYRLPPRQGQEVKDS